jgi:hypothetical protein
MADLLVVCGLAKPRRSTVDALLKDARTLRKALTETATAT